MTCCYSFFKKRPPSALRVVEIDEEFSGIRNSLLYSYKELRSATDNFSPSNKIGEGGFGSVYKGTLRDGTLAAIKVLSAESRQGVREFLTEITLIADIEHDNLVKLYGCCIEGKHRILVYGYLENNSLAQTLLGGEHSNIEFSWQTRRKICMGVAQGLAFLHEEVQPHIIHRDIKASNILLDRDLMPKISDFGLAKLFPANVTHVSTRVAGTAGYLAPEYALRGQLTRKADIYSFGVLLLEIVCGRCNTNRRLPAGQQYLLERVWNFISRDNATKLPQVWELHERGELVKLVDASLDGEFEEEACRFLKIGLLCTQDTSKLRPSMSTVVKILAGEFTGEFTKISRPGLLAEFTGHSREDKPGTNSGSSNPDKSSSTSSNITTSLATMTFNSIYDRD